MKIVNNRLDSAQYIKSPNQSGTITPEVLVLHYTASGIGNDAQYFKRGDAKVSAHLVIERDGKITQCVDFNKKAWHAGVSSWNGKKNCNGFSIGIEIDNFGLLTKRADGKYYSHNGKQIPADKVFVGPNKLGNGKYWEIYPEEQLKAVEECIALIMDTYNIKEIVGHEDIAPRRKIDPGPALYEFIRKMNNKYVKGRTDSTHDDDIRRVIATALNVRSNPSTSADVIGQVHQGQKVRVLYDGGSWSQICDPPGWVFDKYLR